MEAMTFPEELKIGAHTFLVEFLASWPGSDKDQIGETNFDEGRIVIYERLPETLKVSKLFHEVLHVMNPEMDHELLSSLSEQWAQVLLDNDLLK